MAIERSKFAVKIPSLGKFYKAFQGHDGSVEIHPARVLEEKIVAASSAAPYDRWRMLLKSCMATQLDIDDLLVVDNFFLLVKLSSLSYGSKKKVNIRCQNPDCNERFDHTLDLDADFNVTFVPDELTDPVEIELPSSKEKVVVRLLRSRDEAAIRTAATMIRKDRAGKVSKDEITYLLRLVFPVISVDGKELTLADKMEWAENLLGIDAQAIRKAFEDFDFGVDPIATVDCPKCGKEVETALPFQDLFPAVYG